MTRVRTRMTEAGTVAAVAAAVSLSSIGIALSFWAVSSAHRSLTAEALSDLAVLSFTVVGAVVVSVRPRNLVGWFLLLGGTCWSLGNAGANLAYLGIVAEPGRIPVPSALAVLGSPVRGVGWYLVTLGMPLVFPGGRFDGSRWVPRAFGLVLFGALLDPILDEQADLTNLHGWRNPIAPSGAWEIFSGLGFLISVPLSLGMTGYAVIRLIRLWRCGDALRRQQITLLAAGTALPLIAVPISFATGAGWPFSLAALPLPFAIGFAVLAKGLYDLRTAANRTLLWVTLSAVVAAAYALVIAGVGSLLHRGGASWLPWVAAAVVALTFAPLRDALQRAANRLTYGRWDEPYEVLAALGQQLEATVDADGLIAVVASELHGLGLRDVAIRTAQGQLIAGDDGAAQAGSSEVVALAAYGQPVGTLRFRLPAAPLRTRDRRLLDDLAGHLGGVLYARQLTADLQSARERLVLAREEERRRLRRDLHDGLGPALAGHLLRLDVIAKRTDGNAALMRDVAALRGELGATVLEVRRVVEGLRPPALDELGLADSLRQATRRLAAGRLALELQLADQLQLPAAVEVAVFRIVTEAVTNAARHSGAKRCQVTVEAVGQLLRVTVSDDGRGLAQSARGGTGGGGHGLHTMRERAEELRGRLTLSSSEAGTTVTAEFPLPPRQTRPVESAQPVTA